MTIKLEQVREIIQAHETWVDANRENWLAYRAAYTDKYYDRWGIPQDQDVVRPETNIVRSHLESIVAGVFHKVLKTSVRPDEATSKTGQRVLEGFEAGDAQAAIASILNRFVNVQHADVLAEQGFSMGLLYPEMAFKLGVDDSMANTVDKVWMESLPPWECVWNRRSRNWRTIRFIGHLYDISAEDYERNLGPLPADVQPHPLTRMIEEGSWPTRYGATDGEPECDVYVRVFELNDLTSYHQDAEEPGEFRVYLMENNDPREILAKPLPYTKADGRPIPNMQPVVLVPHPDYPCQGLSYAALVYEIEKERNFINEVLATSSRRDAARKVLVKKGAFDEPALNQLRSGRDLELIEVEEENLGGLIYPVPQQPMSPTLFQWREAIEANSGDTQGTASFTRGKGLNYATATEVMALNDYTETFLGRVRKKMDQGLSKLCALYLRVLRVAMGPSLRVDIGAKYVDIPKGLLDIQWEINLTDIGNTPVVEAQKRSDFNTIQKVLLELTQIASVPESPPVLKHVAKLQVDYLVEIYKLPESMSWKYLSQIEAEAPDVEDLAPPDEAPTAEAAASPPAAPGGAPGAAGLETLPTEQLVALRDQVAGGAVA